MYTYRAVLLVLFTFNSSDWRKVDGTYFGGLWSFAYVVFGQVMFSNSWSDFLSGSSDKLIILSRESMQ